MKIPSDRRRTAAIVVTALLVAGTAVALVVNSDDPSAGPSSCGLTNAAFCEPFTNPVAGGREGDLDPAVWQVGRVVGEIVSPSDLQPFPATPIGACKAGVSQATADRDVLICDQASGHAGQALTALSAQNYGLISLSPRQPFDFAGRTGTIVYDVDTVTKGNLGYWTSLFITDLPVPVASSASQVLGYLPRNGLGLTFDTGCGTSDGSKAGVSALTTYANTVETTIVNPGPTCVSTARGQLNHIQVKVSQTQVTVLAGDVGGGNLRQIFTAAVNLGFTRGYLHFQTATRAPKKYSVSPGYATNYWSNIAFDGPQIPAGQVAQVPDSLSGGSTRGTNIGYALNSSGLSLAIPNVPANPSAATLSMAVQLQYGTAGESVSYRLNGGVVHSAIADVAAQQVCSGCPGPSGGSGVGFAFPVAVSELRAGVNTLTLSATGFTGGWPFIVSNVDLWTVGAIPTTTTSATVPGSTTPSSTTPSSTTPSSTTPGSTAPGSTAPGSTAPATTTVPVSNACKIVNPIFCDTFDQPQGQGTRTGDLDPVLWGVSRLGQWNNGNGQRNRLYWPTMTVCGANGPTAPPGDVRICNGRLFEGVNDGHDVAGLHMYPKQPFDFAGRTGIVTFDVGADSEGNHGAWPEFVITDKPVPGTRSDISNTGGTSGNNDVPPPAALNEVGFALDGGCVGQPSTTGVGLVFVARNGGFQEQPFTQTGCVQKGSLTSLNHFEVRVSQNRLEVWGTDPGQSTLKQLAVANNINLTLTRGLVWIDDVHYNADKFPNPNGQRDHQFVWDNLGFDGPATYRDLGFDVADANNRPVAGATDLGYLVGNGQITLPTATVRSVTVPTGAQVVFNYTASTTTPPQISVNGNPFIAIPSPFTDSVGYLWRSISVPIPYSQVNDARNGGSGANTLTFKSTDGLMQVTNITLILVAGAAVPGTGPPPTTTTAPATTVAPTTTSTVPSTTTTSTAPNTTTTAAPSTTTAPTTTVPNTSGWTSTATVSPNPAPAGSTVTVAVAVTSSASRNGLVDVEVYNPTGQVVNQTWFDNQTFIAGQAKTFTATWPVPPSAPTGTYTVKVGIFSPGWGTLYNWNNAARTFTVSPASTPAHFVTLPVGANLPSDATCASQVRPAAEVRPANAGANHTAPTQVKPLPGRLARVTGNFQGTTDELIQWAACKWGIDEDWVRAQTVIESWWYQSATGDYTSNASICAPGHTIGSDGTPGQCPESVGLLQTRWQYMKDAFPSAGTSSAYNLDVALAFRRQCFEGDDTWLNTVERGREYAAGDMWGCMGTWFAGRWYTAPAVTYIGRVQDALAQRTWETPNFLAG